MRTPEPQRSGKIGRVWHVVSCKPRQEAMAEEHLRRQGFDVYLPRLMTRQRRNGAWREGVQALFPRYLFVRVDHLHQSVAPIRATCGAGLGRLISELLSMIFLRSSQRFPM